LDLAALVHRRALERACDQAEVLRLLDWSAMDELLSRAGRRAGVRRLTAVLDAGDIGSAISRSKLERRFLAVCRRASLPRPAVNEWLTVGGEEMQVDFLWHAHRVIAETDGYGVHRTRQAFVRDRRRDRLLSVAGWQVIRFTWDEVTKEPMHVTEVVRKLLARATKPTSSAD
jgi:very-short-patch-repair endonuclease